MADKLFIVKEGDIYYVVEAKAVFEPPDADSTDEQKDAYAELEALVAAGPKRVAVTTTQGDLGGVHGYHAEPPPSDDP